MFNPASSTFQEYPIPTANATTTSITSDPNGNIWFTELGANRLGELRNGIITQFNVPGSTVVIEGEPQNQSCGPTDVVSDKSGHVWVICIFSNQIDEFFPANRTFLSFDLPIFLSGPAGLVFDSEGNFWFTAADAEMIGRGIISELKNDTSNGITEFAPINQTYIFSFQRQNGYLGGSVSAKSSLPTPTGIALSPDGSTLWITEHVDSSFDSYNIRTGSLERYWTSPTNDQFGYSVSLPNGIAVDANGTVWIAEHYGNKIADLDPYTGQMIEYEVPCCGTESAGVYTLTLGPNGTVWFVEILGNAIGELIPTSSDNWSLSVGLSPSHISVKPSSSSTVTLSVAQYGGANDTSSVDFAISGTSNTGKLSGVSANFSPASVELTGYQNSTAALQLTTLGLVPGIYDLTVSASITAKNLIYSEILKVSVSSSPWTDMAIGIIATIALVTVVTVVALTFKVRKGYSVWG
jgi:virginiamycin B lyase